MKKLLPSLFLLVILSISSKTFSQIPPPEFRVKAGYNIASLYVYEVFSNIDYDLYTKPGYRVGFTAEFPLDEDVVSFEPGIFLNSKGYKFHQYQNISGTPATYEENVSLNYLELIFTTKGFIDVGDFRLFALGGPYAALGIGGQIDALETIGAQTRNASVPVDWGFSLDNDHFQPLDYGLLVALGAEYDAFSFQISYSLGLFSITNVWSNDFGAYNQVVGFTFGYAILDPADSTKD